MNIDLNYREPASLIFLKFNIDFIYKCIDVVHTLLYNLIID